MKNFFIGCLSIFFLIGCTNEKMQNEIMHLHHEVLDFPDMLIGSPGDIQKVGDCLIVLDYQLDSLFHRVDLAKNRYIGMFGTKGQGPDDFIHPSSLKILDDDRFTCYDLSTDCLNLIELCQVDDKVGISRMFKYAKMLTFDVVPMSDRLFIVNGETDGAMFALIDKDGMVLSLSDEYPHKDESEKNIPARFRAMAYQGTLRGNSKGYFAYAIRNAKQVHLYKMENNRIVKIGEVIEGYAHYEPNMASEGGYGVAHKGEYPKSYMDLAVTDKYVYALYSGRSFKEYKLSCYECETIYVYDWAGKLVNTYRLDVPIVQFCIDEDENMIYAIANIPDPTIVRFKLD
jgi:hypothetical protein